MRRHVSKIVTLSLLLAGSGACAGTQAPAPAAATAASQAAPQRTGLQIGLTTVYVDDQEKALRFYTEVLGFAEKDDFSNEGYRWLTVTSPADPDGIELQLALNDNPAAKAYQQAMFTQSQPAIMFYTDDVKRDHARITAAGGEFTMPPTEVMAGSVIATLKDGCGNLIQLTQLDR